MKSVQIRRFFWSVFSPNAGKYEPEKTPYFDTFNAVKPIHTAAYLNEAEAEILHLVSSLDTFYSSMKSVCWFWKF